MALVYHRPCKLAFPCSIVILIVSLVSQVRVTISVVMLQLIKRHIACVLQNTFNMQKEFRPLALESK